MPDLTITDVDRLNDPTCDKGNKKVLIEFILASTFGNGLSRHGSHRAFDQTTITSTKDAFGWILKSPPKVPRYDELLVGPHSSSDAILPPPQGSNFVNLTMIMQVNGYSWYTSSSSDYLATAVICIYMLVALAYTFWVLAWGVTSSSWDTATEFLALALQSPGTKVLTGSGAGLQMWDTYERMVTLRAIRDGELERENVGERLVLVVEEGISGKLEDTEDSAYELKDVLKRSAWSITAVATSSISSSLTQNYLKEDEERRRRMPYRKVEIDKKYL